MFGKQLSSIYFSLLINLKKNTWKKPWKMLTNTIVRAKFNIKHFLIFFWKKDVQVLESFINTHLKWRYLKNYENLGVLDISSSSWIVIVMKKLVYGNSTKTLLTSINLMAIVQGMWQLKRS